MRLRWSAPARRDLAAIDDHYASKAPDFADGVGKEAITADQFLLRFPEAGQRIGPDERRRWHVRGTPYRLLYRVEEGGIRILRVAHEQQDGPASE